MQGAHPEAMDMEARVHTQDEPEKFEAKRVLNAKVSAYTLEAGVITHRFPFLQYCPSWMGRPSIALSVCVPALTPASVVSRPQCHARRVLAHLPHLPGKLLATPFASCCYN